MKRLLRILILAIMAIGTVSAAQASYFPYDISNLKDYLDAKGQTYAAANYSAYSGSFSGDYNITAIAYEADYVNQFVAGDDTVLFANNDVDGNTYTKWGEWKATDLSTSYLYDTTGDKKYALSSLPVAIYRLTQDWVVPELGINLSAGTLIFGLNDSWSGDKDYDDIILAANPTPIPGAVWLLGSGLSGLMFLRRRFMI